VNAFLKYFLFGIIFWIVVDFTTTPAIRHPAQYYSTYMPALLIFYVGHPLVFSILIYSLNIRDRWIFLAMLAAIFVVEVIFTHNKLLYTFPMMLIAIPAALGIYSFLTFVPKWIVNAEIKQKKWQTIGLAIVWILVSIATLIGK
jgi:hypothetical protein